LKCVVAIEAAVRAGGSERESSKPESGDLPIIGAGCPFVMCAEDERRDDDERGGVTPPTPCREFIEAFLCNVVGVEERASRLAELGLLCRGLRGVVLAFGEEG
jgi:hypothetical protein